MASNLQNWLGGSPGAVLVKLIFLSLIVGAFMAFLGLTPFLLFERVARAFQSLFGLGFDAIRDVARYILYGAAIVVPVWLIARLLGARR
jgi:hypothetical protein